MISFKRMLIATFVGLLLGVLLALLAARALVEGIPDSGAAALILCLAVAGFVIGISALNWRWWLHGLLLGGICLLPVALAAVWAGLKWWPGFAVLLGAGLIGGVLIELVTTVVFRARAGQAGM